MYEKIVLIIITLKKGKFQDYCPPFLSHTVTFSNVTLLQLLKNLVVEVISFGPEIVAMIQFWGVYCQFFVNF